MSDIEVKAISITEQLKKLKAGEWQIPKFQREFVWTQNMIIDLINSVIESRPIGMVTLWEQEDTSDLELEHISIPDSPAGSDENQSYFGNPDLRPGRFYAILDGKQRSTSLALALGGLSATNGRFKFCGAFFLNVNSEDIQDRVIFIPKKKIIESGLNSTPAYVSSGYYPLSVEDPDKFIRQWMGYINAVDNPENYPNKQLPSEEVRVAHKEKIEQAFEGLSNTKLAVYIVPKEETLADICDIFETLNTTGTKVSTIDLIHSWVYQDTFEDDKIDLREKIDQLGDKEGAKGWSSTKKRPELIAQMLACIQIALDKKLPPRSVAGKKITEIKSIKSNDLLAISSESWREFFQESDFISNVLKDFQELTSGGRFNLDQCPYAGIISVYVALRWHLEFEENSLRQWNQEHLDRLFVAFFWRNSFSLRYDQGFLTRVGADVTLIKDYLYLSTKKKQSMTDWATISNDWLSTKVDRMINIENLTITIKEAVTNGSTKGALRDATRLLLLSRSRKDVSDLTLPIMNLYDNVNLHHIYPKSWCKNNINDLNKMYLSKDPENKNWVDSPANLMPMHPITNNKWKEMEPSMALLELNISSEQQKLSLMQYFIDDKAFNFLSAGPVNVGKFLEYRAQLIVDEYVKYLRV
ncbi:DUF262 domain-containing protein [Emcibacteraceae bacterium]|nr:DUF262 domain-containing protein [Emcibacteraceae bacterium]